MEDKKEYIIKPRDGLEIKTNLIPEILIENLGGRYASVYINGVRFGMSVKKVEYAHKALNMAELTLYCTDDEEIKRINEIASTIKATVNAIKVEN